jgi:DNA recombination-dependent growth factor C
MGILSGAMSVKRFSFEGEIPENFRESWRTSLNDYAFLDSDLEQGKEEREGWVQVHNLLETSFDDFNRWLYNDIAVFALRVDKKTLPANLFRATVQKEVAQWCEERGVERCPKSQKDEIKDRLEQVWLKRCLPRVQLTEVCIHLTEKWVLVHSQSVNTLDRVQKRFLQTFGLKLQSWSPTEWLESAETLEGLMNQSPVSIGEERS